MSRIGRLPVPVPAGVDVTIDGQNVTVKGPKGTLSRTISEPLSVIRQEDGSILVTRPDDERRSRSQCSAGCRRRRRRRARASRLRRESLILLGRMRFR